MYREEMYEEKKTKNYIFCFVNCVYYNFVVYPRP